MTKWFIQKTHVNTQKQNGGWKSVLRSCTLCPHIMRAPQPRQSILLSSCCQVHFCRIFLLTDAEWLVPFVFQEEVPALLTDFDVSALLLGICTYWSRAIVQEMILCVLTALACLGSATVSMNAVSMPMHHAMLHDAGFDSIVLRMHAHLYPELPGLMLHHTCAFLTFTRGPYPYAP